MRNIFFVSKIIFSIIFTDTVSAMDLDFNSTDEVPSNLTDSIRRIPAMFFSCETFKPPGFFKMSQSEFQTYIEIIKATNKTMPFWGIISIIFNVFNVIVWTRKQNKKISVSYFLAALAVSDIGLGYTYFIKGLDSFNLINIKAYRDLANIFIKHNTIYLPFVFTMSNFWITASLATERAICVALPTRAR